ncbi:MAG TPA: hypothetical protein VKC51_10820 [Lacunisphaera sp.]|nr:hypothetical protein [Lacunisphaera sp.]
MMLIVASGCVQQQADVFPTQEMRTARGKTATRVNAKILQASGLELISLDPALVEPERDHPIPPPSEMIDGFRIVGRTTISDRSEIQQLAEALKDGISQGPPFPAGCFFPRHALRLFAGKDTVRIVICFHCENGHMVAGAAEYHFAINRTGEAVFDRIFAEHGLRKAELPAVTRSKP